jgi:hypothetical protein
MVESLLYLGAYQGNSCGRHMSDGVSNFETNLRLSTFVNIFVKIILFVD